MTAVGSVVETKLQADQLQESAKYNTPPVISVETLEESILLKQVDNK